MDGARRGGGASECGTMVPNAERARNGISRGAAVPKSVALVVPRTSRAAGR